MTPVEKFVNHMLQNKQAIESAENVIVDSVVYLRKLIEDHRKTDMDTPTEELIAKFRKTEFHAAMSYIAAEHATALLQTVVNEYVALRVKAARKPNILKRLWWRLLFKLR